MPVFDVMIHAVRGAWSGKPLKLQRRCLERRRLCLSSMVSLYILSLRTYDISKMTHDSTSAQTAFSTAPVYLSRDSILLTLMHHLHHHLNRRFQLLKDRV